MSRYPMVVSAVVRVSVRVGFSAFGGGTDREGRGLCLGTECPETWGSRVVPTSGFQDLLPSVGVPIELLQREKLRGLSVLGEETDALSLLAWRNGLHASARGGATSRQQFLILLAP